MCASLSLLEQILIWIVWLVVIVGVLRIVIPFVLSLVGVSTGPLIPALTLIMWGVIAIFVIKVCFALLKCMGGMHLSLSMLNFVGVG